MTAFGEKLRREREMRGITLDEIALATKIGTRSLKALEDENFSILPGGIFNKGFIRAYARFLGLNEDEAVSDYQTAVQEQPLSVKTIATQSAMAKANRLAAQQAQESSHLGDIARVAVLLAVAVVIFGGGFFVYHRGYLKALKRANLSRQTNSPAVQPQSDHPPIANASTPTETPVAKAIATQAPAPPPDPRPAKEVKAVLPTVQATSSAEEFTVSIKTTALSWLSITADGKRTLQRLFLPNEQQDITAKSKIRIKIGNPGGTELSLNGHPLAIAGDLSRPRIVTVGASGVQSE